MEQEQFNEQISRLKNLPRAEAPPFLFTRIAARLEQRYQEANVPARYMVLAGMGLLLLLALNVRAFRQEPNMEGRQEPTMTLANDDLQIY